MQKLFEAVLGTSIAMIPVIFLLLILTPILGKRYSAKIRYFIWIAVAFRLIIPINISLNSILRHVFPASNLLNQVDDNAVMEAVRAALAMQLDSAASPMARQNAGQSGLSLLGVLAIIWLVGFVLFMTYHTVTYRITRRNLQRWSIAAYDPALLKSFDEKKSALSIKKKIGLYQNDKISTPMLIGLFSPCILLPNRPASALELTDILRHELCHYKRGDLWYKLLMLLANGVQWFNPLVYIMLRQAEMDMELACDYDVLLDADSLVRRQYGLTILSFVEQKKAPCTPLTTCFYGSKEQMKQRFSDIARTSKKKSGKIFFATIMFMIVFCGVWVGNVSAAVYPEKNQIQTAQTDTQPNSSSVDELIQRQEEQWAELDKVYGIIEPNANPYEGGRMAWPVPGYYYISSPFGMRFNDTDFHTGIDISGENIYGAPVIAAGDGTVMYVNRDYKPGVGYGIYLIIDHGGDITTLYSHLSEVNVNVGDTVEKGQHIANIGSTGYSTGPNLQFEVREDGKAVDPIPYLTPEE